MKKAPKKSDLIKEVQRRLPDLPEEDVSNAVSLIFAQIVTQLKSGGGVEIRGFGSFSTRNRTMSANSRAAQFGYGIRMSQTFKTVYYRDHH
ncbi:MAG: HU family DNA-binding protein [Rickettsiaceae bacterium]|nr:HU family DNA-binding protein [Rickettsiaceae bacterium]